MPITHPTLIHEDNNVIIQQIQADTLTKNIKHLDIMMSYAHEQENNGTFVAIYRNTEQNKSDINTTPLGGETL